MEDTVSCNAATQTRLPAKAEQKTKPRAFLDLLVVDAASDKMDLQVTDDDGRFVYAARRGEKVVLTVTAPGHAPELLSFTMDDRKQELTISLSESQPMSGRVVGPDAEPVPFAWIFPDTWRGSRSLETRIQADKDGKFIWKDAPPDEVQCDIDDTSAGYIRAERNLVAGDKETISVSFIDSQLGQGLQRMYDLIETTTDAAGRFSFDRIPAGKIAVSRRVDIPTEDEASEPDDTLTRIVNITEGETETIELEGE